MLVVGGVVTIADKEKGENSRSRNRVPLLKLEFLLMMMQLRGLLVSKRGKISNLKFFEI